MHGNSGYSPREMGNNWKQMCLEEILESIVSVVEWNLLHIKSATVLQHSIWKMVVTYLPCSAKWDIQICRWPEDTQRSQISCLLNAIRTIVQLLCCKVVLGRIKYNMRRGFALKANPLLYFDTNLNSSFQKDSKRSKISTFINYWSKYEYRELLFEFLWWYIYVPY